MLVESVKDLNKLNYNGVDVDVFQLEDQDPLFRSNGYDVNGEKLPFALEFDETLNESLLFPTKTNFTTINNLEWFFNGSINIDGSSTYVCTILSGSGRFRFRKGGSFFVVEFLDLSGGSQTYFSPSITGVQSVSLSLLNGVLNYNGSDVKTFTDDDVSGFNNAPIRLFNNNDNLFSSGQLYDFIVNGESLLFDVGLGTKIKTSEGNEIDINTNAAQSKQRINFGMWLQGNDIDGWTPYTKD